MGTVPSWAWIAPIIASVIALIGVSFGIYIQSKNFRLQIESAHKLKISEMRQKWIDNLRDAMSTFQSYGVAPSLNHLEKREWYESGTKIELLMNPKDPDFSELQKCMYAFFEAEGADDVAGKYSANPAYINICQRILKREWEVLKKEVGSLL